MSHKNQESFGLIIDANVDWLMTDNLSHLEKVACFSNSNKLTKNDNENSVTLINFKISSAEH